MARLFLGIRRVTGCCHLSFAIHDTFRNIAHVGENRIVISDVDGNRYGITDVSALDRASYRRIELYL